MLKYFNVFVCTVITADIFCVRRFDKKWMKLKGLFLINYSK